MNAFFISVQSDINDKVERLSASMDESTGWLGAQGIVECRIDAEQLSVFKGGILDMRGNGLFVAIMRNNARRHGPQAVPCTTMGSLFFGTLDSEEPVYIHAMPIDQLLKLGITIDALEKFLESDTGSEYLEKWSVVLPIPYQSVLYLPGGWVTFMLRHEAPTKRNQTLFGLSHVAHIPLAGDFQSIISPEVQKPMYELLREHLSARTNSPMWKERFEYVKAAFGK